MRAAIVGAGLMGRWHAHELVRAGGTLVAVSDADPAAAASLADAHAEARAFGRLDRLLAETGPEVVHVCTPPDSHFEIAERALQAGAHALVEKPITPTAAETERLLEVAALCGRLACPVHQYLFQPPLRRAGRVLEKLAPILELNWVACSAGAVGRPPEEASDLAAEILPHPLAALHRLLALDVAELEWSASRPRAGELRAVSAANGTGVSIMVSMGGRPTRNELHAIGAGGTLHIDLFHGYAVVEPSAVSRARKIARPFALSAATAGAATANLARRALAREPAYPGLRTLIRELYAYARGRAAAPIPRDECLAVARAHDRVLAAAGDAVEH